MSVRVKEVTIYEFQLSCNMCKKHLGQKSSDVYSLCEHYRSQRWYISLKTFGGNVGVHDMEIDVLCPDCQEKIIQTWCTGDDSMLNYTGEVLF